MEQQQQTKFDEWALLDLFGHQQLAGRVSEANIAGQAFVRVDIPDAKGRIALTKYYHPNAIYSIAPCEENIAVARAQTIDSAPVKRYQLEQYAQTRSLPLDEDEED